jgi:hypothetical protein
MAATVAVCTHEAMCKDATPEVPAKLRFDIPGEATTIVFSGVGEEGFQILADGLIEDRLGRATRAVRRGECGQDESRIADPVPSSGREIPPTWKPRALCRTVCWAAADTPTSPAGPQDPGTRRADNGGRGQPDERSWCARV